MAANKIFSKIFPVLDAEAHCDIPCGIYDPTAAKIAAKTVQRMVMQLEEIVLPQDMTDPEAVRAYLNMISRRIRVKEEHAETCKRELQILWSDFFKEEHLAQFPDLHNKFWKALKLCSKNKQEINKNAAHELIAAVDEIAQIFYQAKSDPKRYEAYKEVTDKVF